MTTETETAPLTSTPSAGASRWDARADVAQQSLAHWFGAPAPQLFNLEMGYASALSFVLFLIIMVFSVINAKINKVGVK